ncbi:MAG: tetratricopeptide repeat protein [Gammaproteobacteria bacterium]
MIDNLQAMLDAGQDNALLRFTLGSQLLKAGNLTKALPHLEAAVRQDPDYSAAWKLYGKALHEAGELVAARDVYRQGIGAAERKGDIQAVREMRVFLKRVERALADSN